MTDVSDAGTVGGLLMVRAALSPERLAFRELKNDLSLRDQVTYGELDRRAARIAGALAQRLASGERVVLICAGAIDYLTCLFGCLYAGTVAVSGLPPYAPGEGTPRRSARRRRLQTVIETSGAAAILGTRDLLDRVAGSLGPDGAHLAYVALEDAAAADPSREPGDPAGVAMLQFTSGSTSPPGGVVLRHRNLIANLRAQEAVFQANERDVGVSWLPLFHDLGLIGGCLLPIYCGFPSVLMPSAGFLEQPRRWLECLSDHGGTISWAPNFAYKLCAKAIGPDQRRGLDLSRWRIAMNAAEPVQAQTIRQFTDAFAANGFDAGAMYPCYGLAEATLVVTAPRPGEGVHVVQADREALAHGAVVPPRGTDADRSVELVSCGRAVPGMVVVVADPQMRQALDDSQIGEIWVAGEGRSEGYFGEARSSFEVTLAGDPTTTWLATGDLGFLRDGELFVTGRRKDMIILRGGNIYPQDLEQTAAASHAALRDDCACAVSVTLDGDEGLALFCEIERARQAEAQEAARAVRRAIFREHGLETVVIVIIRTASMPKTPSGKVQRAACRAAYAAGELPVVDELWASGLSAAIGGATAPDNASPLRWLSARLGALAPDVRIHLDLDLADLGLSSVQVTELAAEIETQFGRRIPAAELYEVRRLSDILGRLEVPSLTGAGSA